MNNQEPPCECSQAGFCPRYQIKQAEHHVDKCRRSNEWRKKWRENLERKLTGAPSLIQRAVNASKALVRNAQNRFRRVSLDVLTERETICNACDLNDKERGLCKHPECGCNVQRGLVNKLALAAEKCPMGKWGVDSCQ